jgi:hypothetical protein
MVSYAPADLFSRNYSSPQPPKIMQGKNPISWDKSDEVLVSPQGLLLGGDSFSLGKQADSVMSARQKESNRFGCSRPSLPKPPADLVSKTHSIASYMGADPLEATFRQGSVGDCYFLAAVDSLQHHPQGKALLESIRVDMNFSTQTCTIFFPSGKQEEIKIGELGQPQNNKKPIQASAPGVAMLELAYAQMVSRTRSQKWYAYNFGCSKPKTPFDLVSGGLGNVALNKILIGDKRSEITVMKIHPVLLKNFLRKVAQDERHDYILTASRGPEWPWLNLTNVRPMVKGNTKLYRDHSYSLRSINLKDNTVTVANPHDTKNQVLTLTMKEFCRVFSEIDGIKFKKEPKP